MRARKEGHCNLCDTPIEMGEDIGKWIREWVHATCKERAREALVVTSVTILPESRWTADRKDWVTSAKIRRDMNVGKVRNRTS